MTAEIIQFLPRANPKADRAFWIGPDYPSISILPVVRVERSDLTMGHADTAPCEMNMDEPA